MEKFDLEQALAGNPVITRNGLRVSDLYLFDVNECPLVCQIEGSEDFLIRCEKDGKCTSKMGDDYDLFMEEEGFYGFKNGDKFYLLSVDEDISVFTYNANEYFSRIIKQGNAFKTKEEAEKEREYRQAKFRLNAKMRELEGGWRADWYNESQHKYYFGFDTYNGSVFINKDDNNKFLEDWRYSNLATITWVIDNMKDDIKIVLGVS